MKNIEIIKSRVKSINDELEILEKRRKHLIKIKYQWQLEIVKTEKQSIINKKYNWISQ